MAVNRKPTRRASQPVTRRPTQIPRKGGTPAPVVVLAQPTNLTVTEV